MTKRFIFLGTVGMAFIMSIIFGFSEQTRAEEPATDNRAIVEVDLTKLSDIARNAVLDVVEKEKRLAEKSTGTLVETAKAMDAETIESWSASVSTTIKTVCNDLSVSVNDFIKTDVGKITVFLIAYHFIGDDVKNILFTIIWWPLAIIGTCISFVIFHIPKKIVTKDANGMKNITYEQRYKFESKDAKVASVAVHIAIIAVSSIIAILIICS